MHLQLVEVRSYQVAARRSITHAIVALLLHYLKRIVYVILKHAELAALLQ